MLINETFTSIQGEGFEAGMPAFFIRTGGCNFDCSWCDTKYADSGTELSVEEVLKLIPEECINVVITGGEPFLQKDLFDVVKRIRKKVFIETNGSIFDARIIGYATIIVSPKLHMLKEENIPLLKNYKLEEYLSSLRNWAPHATFKFVIGGRYDFIDAYKMCILLNKRQRICLMPRGTTDETLKKGMCNIVDWIKEWEAYHMWVSPRLHVSLYGSQRGV